MPLFSSSDLLPLGVGGPDEKNRISQTQETICNPFGYELCRKQNK